LALVLVFVGLKMVWLNAAFGGSQSMADALKSMQQTLEGLPAESRNQLQ
ncbi:MAG: hypothetical protein HGA86_06885, partial [Anaerolineaceae bacterium]|nr:hypothetical protein [Anaerolineaceae bacterium]